MTELPVGLRVLILAGIFAAAISGLDSILLALSLLLSLLKQKSGEDSEKKAVPFADAYFGLGNTFIRLCC